MSVSFSSIHSGDAGTGFVSWRDLGIAEMNGGNYKEAKACFEQAIKRDRRDAVSERNLGIAYCFLLKSGEAGDNFLEEAVEHLQNALSLDGDDLLAQLFLGALLAETANHQQDWKEIADLLEPIVKANPENGFACSFYGKALYRSNELENAETYLCAAVIQEKHTHFSLECAYLNLGSLLFDAGRFDEAEPYLEKVLKINENEPEALLKIGQILCRKKEFKRGLMCLQSSCVLLPSNEKEFIYNQAKRAEEDFIREQNTNNQIDAPMNLMYSEDMQLSN